ncbi:MAG: hypothetical protein HGA65_11650 [Oscillochloris sp.]|nr:hypothetical protein [Oscillochloris sp.]
MGTPPQPDLENFLHAPATDVAAIAPATVMFAAGGTRRDAVLNGHDVSHFNLPLADFSIRRMTETAGNFFKLGLRNVVSMAVRTTQLAETGPYRDYIIEGTIKTLGELALPYYRQLGCRVRLLCHDDIPEFAALADLLDTSTADAGPHTIWWIVARSNEQTWQRMIAAAQGASSFAEVSQRYLGATIPPVSLFISFGKLFVSPELIPLPLFGEDVHCYFYQRPGYSLSEQEIRSIIYDYAYQRKTWVSDKSGRYAGLESQRHIWNNGPILGLGRRVGGFWYPANAHDEEL